MLSINNNEVHVWWIHQATMGGFEISNTLPLSKNEVARAKRFKLSRQGQWWAFIHVAMREILGQYLSKPASELDFTRGKYGKPSLARAAQPSLHFNLSHSGDYALLALSYFSPVGVDIEVRSGLKDMNSVVKRFFSPQEQQQFNPLPKVKQIEVFYNIWTCKEALIKANGLGLIAPLSAFDVPIVSFTDWLSPVTRAPLDSCGYYQMMQLEPAPSFAAALCLCLQEIHVEELPKVYEFNYLVD